MAERRPIGLVLAGCLVATALATTACSASSTGHAVPSASPSVSSTPAPHVTPLAPASRSAAASRSSSPVTSRSFTAASTTVGTLRSVSIPGTSSHFVGRPAVLWLPPVLRAHPTTRLPVLELLHGTPGKPMSWVNQGDLVATMNAFAAAHGGRAPIVVMPDVNGSEHGDSECVRTPSGANVETYLTRDVPRWTAAHYRTLPAPNGWAVGGLSEGGMCSVMLSLRTHAFSSFVDLSGLGRPTVGEHDDPARTIAQLFGGSRAAYDQHDPLYLLARHRYPTLGGWFACGSSDTAPLQSQKRLVAAGRKAGLTVQERIVPGKHAWPVWSSQLRLSLPWLWARVT